MDVHENLPEGVTAADVAHAHAANLAKQDAHRVKYVKYWVDEKERNAFCLVDAPDADAAIRLHREAHGLVADSIFEGVEGASSFLVSTWLEHRARSLRSRRPRSRRRGLRTRQPGGGSCTRPHYCAAGLVRPKLRAKSSSRPVRSSPPATHHQP